ncbi:hypothetical protein [Iamia sp.]|uniref:hypothetical protein n=1 Tax=Iamia sp. TaxID=2722710 RepID=UPI002B91BFF4|nr:hypothetical protein [Iamia sp.]HXH56276.1 hypothetical protein [Iamia sp.]
MRSATRPADIADHPAAPRRPRALAALCNDLTATRTTYPGTNLTLTYAVKNR